jgi:hypothetical protein
MQRWVFSVLAGVSLVAPTVSLAQPQPQEPFVGRQGHGARRRHFRQGDGATFSPGSWGHPRVIGPGFRQGHGASKSPGSWGHP